MIILTISICLCGIQEEMQSLIHLKHASDIPKMCLACRITGLQSSRALKKLTDYLGSCRQQPVTI